MSDIDKGTKERLQAVLAALLQHQLTRSLERVADNLERWRRGEVEPFDAHASVLEHAARSERLAQRVALASRGGDVRSCLRDALDAGIIARDEFIELAGVEPEHVQPSAGDDERGMPQKLDVVRELIERGPVLVHVDARGDEVSVPLRLKRDPKLVLRFGYGLSPPISDLHLDEQALSGTLTFSGVPHHCVLPWSAVYAVVSESDQQGMVWPQDVPSIVLQEMSGDGDAPAPTGTEPKTRQRASHLKLVE